MKENIGKNVHEHGLFLKIYIVRCVRLLRLSFSQNVSKFKIGWRIEN